MIFVPDVQNREGGQLLSDPTDDFWPLQARHFGVGDQEINGGDDVGA